MRIALVVAATALLGPAACAPRAAAPLAVRGLHGQPLPTTARLDAVTTPATLHCGSARYLIADEPAPFLAGTRLSTRTVTITDAPALCARIRRAR